MKKINIKVRDGDIELCFSDCNCLVDALCAIETLAKNSKSFFEGADAVLKYSGITLNYNEEIELSEGIKKVLGENVRLIMKNTLTEREILYSMQENERLCTVTNNTVRSGEKVEARGNIVIYGDVNPGGEVIAKGDVCIIGNLRGIVQTGEGSRVFALSMKPTQIRIGKAISYNKKNENVGAAVAIAENGEIILQCL